MTTKIDIPQMTTIETILTILAYHINVPPPHVYKSDWGCVHGPYPYFDPDFETKRKQTILHLLHKYKIIVVKENIDISEHVNDLDNQELDQTELAKLLEEEYNEVIKSFKKVSSKNIQSPTMFNYSDYMECYKHCNRYIFISGKIIPSGLPTSEPPLTESSLAESSLAEPPPENANLLVVGVAGVVGVAAVALGFFIYWKTH